MSQIAKLMPTWNHRTEWAVFPEIFFFFFFGQIVHNWLDRGNRSARCGLLKSQATAAGRGTLPGSGGCC